MLTGGRDDRPGRRFELARLGGPKGRLAATRPEPRTRGRHPAWVVVGGKERRQIELVDEMERNVGRPSGSTQSWRLGGMMSRLSCPYGRNVLVRVPDSRTREHASADNADTLLAVIRARQPDADLQQPPCRRSTGTRSRRQVAARAPRCRVRARRPCGRSGEPVEPAGPARRGAGRPGRTCPSGWARR